MHIILALAVLWAVALSGCSSTKHVPDGEYLLDRVKITVDDPDIKASELVNFLRQQPNHKTLGVAKMQLGLYSLSGKDSAKWYNRWLQNIGQPPVIYDRELTDMSRRQLQQAMINRGYMDAYVVVDTMVKSGKKKIGVEYSIFAGKPHRIASFNTEIADSAIARIIRGDQSVIEVSAGDMFDRTKLDNMRASVTSLLRNNGLYSFTKENIRFYADTVRGSKDIDLTMRIDAVTGVAPVAPYALVDADTTAIYRIRRVTIVTDYDNAGGDVRNLRFAGQDTVMYDGLTILYGRDRYLNPSIIAEKCYLEPGQVYRRTDVERTYQGMAQLGILKFVNIEMREEAGINGQRWLDAYVLMSKGKNQSLSLEVEGTHSEGDFGFGLGATYKHNNLARSGDIFTMKMRGAYEHLSGDYEEFVNHKYTEFAAETGIEFPKFEFPFLSKSYRKRWRASTEFALSFNHQNRPEYTRVIVGAAWKYKWHRAKRDVQFRYTYDLIDVNYVRLPKSSLNFLDSIAPTNPLLRYSYEDHFIMRMGFSFQRTNRRAASASLGASTAVQPVVNTFRGSAEVAGNLLYGISELIGRKRHDGVFTIFGIQYAQYAKAEFSFSRLQNFNWRNALVLHVAAGVAVPYLNSSMVPFEKRFYAGGANSVRGWGVRSLGPGAYDSRNLVTDFINQCGDIMLLLNAEYRGKISRVVEGAAFIDAGNIWTIRSYENQPGGVFKLDEFYKQIALSYGIGLRLDFTYFLLRFDMGMKAHNPAMNQEPWPLLHPRFKRDAAFHFSVGYPF